jgi:DNA repair exonuclease SbcCD ATPase subunit
MQVSEEQEVNYEVEAQKDGWVPEEKYKGPKDNWVDAETFVKRGKEINSILRANNERLKKELEGDRQKHVAELEDVKRTVEEFKTFQKEAFEKKVQTYERQLRELRAARSEATSQEDHEKAAELEEQIDKAKDKIREAKADLEKKPEPKKVETKVEDLAPELKQWLNLNPWYGDADNYLEETELVTALGASIKKRNPNITGQAFLDLLDEKIDERIPDLRKKEKKGPSVESSSYSKPSGSRTKKSYSSLPAEAKEACDRFVAQKLMTQDQYVTEYYAGE